MIGHHIQGDPGLVVIMIQEVFEPPRLQGASQGQARIFHLGSDLHTCPHHRIVERGIELRAHMVFAIGLVEHPQVVMVLLEMMAGLVPFPEFIRKSTPRVPTHYAGVIVRHLLHAGSRSSVPCS